MPELGGKREDVPTAESHRAVVLHSERRSSLCAVWRASLGGSRLIPSMRKRKSAPALPPPAVRRRTR
jgi:hypothetical protein